MSCDECEKGRCSDEDQCIIDLHPISYDEDSNWRAFRARDRCYIGGPHNAPLVDISSGTDSVDAAYVNSLVIDLDFGCQTIVTGIFQT